MCVCVCMYICMCVTLVCSVSECKTTPVGQTVA